MKHPKLLGTVLIGALVSACSGEEARAGERSGAERVGQEAGEAWNALRGYAFDRREELEQELAEEMNDWNRGIDRLASDVEGLAGDARDELKSRLADLGRRRDDLAAQLEQLEASGEDGWSELRDGVVDSMERMQQALTDAAATVRDDA